MSDRRLRATFLLQLALLLASVAIFALVVVVATSVPVRLGVAFLLLMGWVVGIEMDLLPLAIERVILRRAAGRRGSSPSIWFVDVETEHRKKMERLRAATRDNAALH